MDYVRVNKFKQFFEEISILEEDPNYHSYYRCGMVPMKNCIMLGDRVADAGKEIMLNMLISLKEKGFKISMDDFGTGYSSLALLAEMPMDTIKIDKSFVDKIGNREENNKECVVIRRIIELARELGFVCLAEGAEKKEQVDVLKEFGCEIVQGYYFSKPLPIEEYEKLL